MQLKEKSPKAVVSRFLPADLYSLMDQLARFAGEYRKSGGIHSAAVGEGRTILLYSEDVGRHNTLDRIAGEALFNGINLEGKVLLTSGRVSTEMVTKAAMLGISLIASRTSPTDLAVQLAEKAGIPWSATCALPASIFIRTRNHSYGFLPNHRPREPLPSFLRVEAPRG